MTIRAKYWKNYDDLNIVEESIHSDAEEVGACDLAYCFEGD